MKIVLVGCEYSGTTTLAGNIYRWNNEVMDRPLSIVHDHWKIPETWGHPDLGSSKLKGMTADEYKQVIGLSSRIKENTQRQSLYYHIFPNKDINQSFLSVGLHFDDAIYAPMYFNYGIEGEFDVDRKVVFENVEEALLRYQPETLLVLLRARPEIIAERMNNAPHEHGVLLEKDIGYVLNRFEEEYESSIFTNKIAIDTSDISPDETMAEFKRKFEPFMSDRDKLDILVKRAKQKGEWL